MSDGQTDLAVFKDIAGEVRGSLGYVERLIGMPSYSRKYQDISKGMRLSLANRTSTSTCKPRSRGTET